jgi:high-affinity nickel-transport protein
MCVAVMLVLLGAVHLKTGARTGHVHSTRELRPLLVGMVHGLAGSAAIALLVLATIKTAALALVYLVVFGAGTLIGMTALTLSLSFPLAALAQRFHDAERHLSRVAGAASLVFGLFLAYQIGVTQGLLSSAPQWTPH